MSVTLYLVSGSDEFLVNRKTAEILDRLVPPDQRDFGLDIIDGAADSASEAVEMLGKCRESLMTAGFLGDRKVTWLKDAGFFCDNRIGKSESVREALGRFVEEVLKKELPGGNILLVSSQKTDKRYAFYKTFKRKGEIFEFEMPEKDYQAQKYAAETIKPILASLGIEMSNRAETLFVDKVGFDTRSLANEAEKLSIYLGNNRKAGEDDVRTITSVSRNASMWDVGDAFGERDLRKALQSLRRLIYQKENLVGLVIQLARRVREITLVREAIDHRWLEVRKAGRDKVFADWKDPLPAEIEASYSVLAGGDPRKWHPYRVRIVAGQAMNFNLSELTKCRELVMKAYAEILSSAVPKPIVLELLIIRMLRRRSRA